MTGMLEKCTQLEEIVRDEVYQAYKVNLLTDVLKVSSSVKTDHPNLIFVDFKDKTYAEWLVIHFAKYGAELKKERHKSGYFRVRFQDIGQLLADHPRTRSRTSSAHSGTAVHAYEGFLAVPAQKQHTAKPHTPQKPVTPVSVTQSQEKPVTPRKGFQPLDEKYHEKTQAVVQQTLQRLDIEAEQISFPDRSFQVAIGFKQPANHTKFAAYCDRHNVKHATAAQEETGVYWVGVNKAVALKQALKQPEPPKEALEAGTVETSTAVNFQAPKEKNRMSFFESRHRDQSAQQESALQLELNFLINVKQAALEKYEVSGLFGIPWHGRPGGMKEIAAIVNEIIPNIAPDVDRYVSVDLLLKDADAVNNAIARIKKIIERKYIQQTLWNEERHEMLNLSKAVRLGTFTERSPAVCELYYELYQDIKEFEANSNLSTRNSQLC